MSHKDKTMVSLKPGLSFAWLDKTLNIKLKEVVGAKGRTSFIRKSAKEQFGLEITNSLDLIEFDRIIKKYHYQDRADWLRSICRNKINQKGRINFIEYDKKIKELLEKQIYNETYIESLKATVEDLKMALYTISQLDNIKDAIKISEQMLNDFYKTDEVIKKTTLQKEKESFLTLE